jgi:hypothetical protein
MQILILELTNQNKKKYNIEKIMSPSRLSTKINKKWDLNHDRMVIDSAIEPILIKIGFREVKFFEELSNNLTEFFGNLGVE